MLASDGASTRVRVATRTALARLLPHRAAAPRVLALAEPVADALRHVEFALGSSTLFDAATAQRSFTVRGVEGVSYLLIAPLMATLAQVAPGIVARCLDAQTGSVPELLDRFRNRDHA